MAVPRVVSLLALSLISCARTPAPQLPPPDPPPAPIAPTTPAVVAQEESPPPPPEPPYDLAADLTARKTSLRDAMGKKTRFEVVEGVFLIASPSGQLGNAGVVTKSALEAYFNGRFGKRPERAVAILLFDNAPPYDAYCKHQTGKPCFTPFGYYDGDTRTVVMNVGPGIGTLTHELVHPIVETDFPSAPTWINEGIASLYEAFAMPKKGEIRGQKNFRWPGLAAALKAKDAHASLPTLFAMSDKVFRGEREGLNYALARYFCQWMESQKTLWPFYQKWRDDFANDKTGEKAFVAVMGKTPAQLDEAWAKWVRAL